MFLGCFDIPHEGTNADYVVGERVELGAVLHRLAAMLFNHGTSRCANGELPMDVVESVDDTRAKKNFYQAGKLEQTHLGWFGPQKNDVSHKVIEAVYRRIWWGYLAAGP